MNQVENWQDRAAEVVDRNPRDFPIGYFSGGSFVMDSVRVFSWFSSVEEMIDHLVEVEPRIHDADESFDVIREALVSADSEGLTADLRLNINKLVKDSFVIDWWGEFKQLRAGADSIARDIVDDYLGEDQIGGDIADDDIDDFVVHLKTCRC